MKAKNGNLGKLRYFNKRGVETLMVILRVKMVCFYEGLEEQNAHKTEFWIKSVERDMYINKRAKLLATTMTNQCNRISDDDEDIIDKRRKNGHCWLFIDKALLIHDTCVGEDVVTN